jgi:hypothetical protein
VSPRDLFPHLRAVADALPAGTPVPVPREALLALLDAQDVIPLANPHEAAGAAEDRLLTVEEAAAALNVTADWLYRRSKSLPFARHLSRKQLRFSEQGLRKGAARR